MPRERVGHLWILPAKSVPRHGLRQRRELELVAARPGSPLPRGALTFARRARPRGYRTAEHRNELAPLHSMTSSARSARPAGTSCPIALAVFRLMTSSNLVGCSIGRSAGLAPLRILATIRAR